MAHSNSRMLRAAYCHALLHAHRFTSVKISKRKLELKLELGWSVERALKPYHSSSITPKRKTIITPKKKLPYWSPTERDVPCIPKQEVKVLYHLSKRKTSFLPSNMPSQRKNATVQPTRSRPHLNIYFSPMNFQLFLIGDILSLSCCPHYKTLLCCINLQSICLPDEMPQIHESLNKANQLFKCTQLNFVF